ncbi:MAG: type II secretion system protein, partial [Candidatus Gastranaerophilaceae bacterium]
MKRFGYTLAEIVIVMLIIAVIVGVSIKVTKSRLDNVISYTYYSTYSTLRSVTSNMLADFNPNDEIYHAKNNIIKFSFLNLFTYN